MKLLPSVNAEADKAALLADPEAAVVLFANADACVLLVRESDSAICNDDNAPAFVIWGYVSTNHPKVVECYVSQPDPKAFEYNGTSYPYSAMEIEDVTPEDQSDLSYPGAIANDPPEQYPAYAVMHQRWSDPNGARIQRLLESIRRGDEYVSPMEAAPTAV